MGVGEGDAEREDGPLACTLDDVALGRRLAEWRAVRREALVSETQEGSVTTTVWLAGEGVFDRLARLVDAERTCCSFLRFELTRGSDEIRLVATAPRGADAALTAFR